MPETEAHGYSPFGSSRTDIRDLSFASIPHRSYIRLFRIMSFAFYRRPMWWDEYGNPRGTILRLDVKEARGSSSGAGGLNISLATSPFERRIVKFQGAVIRE